MRRVEDQRNAAEELGRKLRPRERQFVREYLRDLNGTAAAIRTGYSEKSAASQASRLLRKPEVRDYRDALLQEQFDAIGVTKHSLAAAVWEVYQRCMEKKPVLEWDTVARAWVESGLWQMDSKGALRALDLLSKMLPGLRQEDDGGSYEDFLDEE